MAKLVPVLLIIVLVAGSLAWGVGILFRSYDYDEVQRAHTIWLTSQHLRPYHDFFECHPPYFVLLSPLVRAVSDPGGLLLSLRLVALVGNLLFLWGLAEVAALVSRSGRLASLLATALVAFHPSVLEFLVEFRIDGWGWAAAIWSIALFLRSRRWWRSLMLGVGSGIATLFLCPKLAFLPPMLVVVEPFIKRATLRSGVKTWLGFGLGLAAAFILFCVYLLANGIGMDHAFAYYVTYNARSNSGAGFGYGLLGQIVWLPGLDLMLAAGLIAFVFHIVRSKSLPEAYPLALMAWLATQVWLVSYPYKQYYGPWLLLASGFLPFLVPLLGALSWRVGPILVIGACLVSLTMSAVTIQSWAASRTAQDLVRLLRFMNQVAEPADHVVAPPPTHPIARRDTFFLWFNNEDPKGHDAEQVLSEIPLAKQRVTDTAYREELERHPPAFAVLVWSLYPQRQREVLRSFLGERGYRVIQASGVPFAVRPDRVERARQSATP